MAVAAAIMLFLSLCSVVFRCSGPVFQNRFRIYRQVSGTEGVPLPLPWFIALNQALFDNNQILISPFRNAIPTVPVHAAVPGG